MAYLLGTEACIESLRNDLSDVQETIDEIVNRSGPVKCYSWKSPDKLALDLPIPDLLDRFQHSADEVDNQMAHYSLLELIIDRLLLLVYLSGTSIDTSLNESSVGTQRRNSNSKITHVTAGLAIKKYWNKLSQLMTTVRQLNCQNKTMQSKQKDSDQLSIKSGRVVSSKPPISQVTKISTEIGFKSTQTSETSFVPCESCAKVQTNLKQNADQLINICHYQNIQSNVGKYRASLMSNQLIGGWLSGDELEKWLAEQDKDLGKVGKHMEFLANNNQLMTDKMKEAEANVARFKANEVELKKAVKDEKDTQGTCMRQYEKKLVDQRTELECKIGNLEKEIKSLSDLKLSLDEKYENLKNLHENNEKIIVELNETNRLISSELELKCEQKEKLHHAEEEVLVARTEMDCLRRELNEKNAVITAERAKLEDLIRSQESSKLKHESFADTIDKLTVEKETYEKKYNTVKQEKQSFLELIQAKKEQLENLEYEKEILQNSINELKGQVKKLKDNEVLLLRYPDLYGPVEQLEELSVSEEMQNQITANQHRIALLTNLNDNLNTSVRKLNEGQSRPGSTSLQAQQRATSTRNQSLLMNNNKGSIDLNDVTQQDYFMKLQESNAETPKSRVPSRQYPLFKLEDEIDQEETLKIDETERTWNPSQSYHTIHNSTTNEVVQNDRVGSGKTRTPGELPMPIKPVFNQNLRSDISDNSANEEVNNEDDEIDFMSEKHAADKSYLSKLDQINQNSELKVEANTDFSMLKNRRHIPSRENSFLYSPAPSGRNSAASQNSYRPNSGKPNSAIRRTPIPPADKTMEVVVGKGRRTSVVGSARSNAVTPTGNRGNLPPQTPTSNRPKSGLKSATSHPPSNFKCENCPKKYNNKKDLDIHKMYCS